MKIKLTESKLKQIVAESVKKVLRENHWDNNQYNLYMKEITAIDPDVAEGWNPDFEEHPELRNTKAYKMAYNHASEMDWYVHGDLDVDSNDIDELASDAQWSTNIPSGILYQAMVDYLEQELGYNI